MTYSQTATVFAFYHLVTGFAEFAVILQGVFRHVNTKTAFRPPKTVDLLVLDCRRSEQELAKAVAKVAEKRGNVAPLPKEQSHAWVTRPGTGPGRAVLLHGIRFKACPLSTPVGTALAFRGRRVVLSLYS